MGKIVPDKRPQQTREETLAKLAAFNLDAIDKVTLLGVRSYYEDTMGVVGENDQAMYDDAFFIASPNTHLACNFNTDPQKAGHKLAKLSANGIYTFHRGLHKGVYRCLRQFPEDSRWPCTRDGKPSLCGAIQIHKGGRRDTFSAGCQTIYPDQYDNAISTIYSEMSKYNQTVVKYLLIEN